MLYINYDPLHLAQQDEIRRLRDELALRTKQRDQACALAMRLFRRVLEVETTSLRRSQPPGRRWTRPSDLRQEKEP